MNARRLGTLLALPLVPLLVLAACSSAATSPGPTFGDAPTSPAVPTTAAGSTPSAAPSVNESVPSVAPADAWTVVMTDTMRFEPGAMTVKAGVPITFMVSNNGLIVHEFFIGTEAEQVEHAAEMASGGMHHGHANALSLEPGATDSLTMTFAAAGSLLVGCHEPGHYEAGMAATLTIVD